MGTLRCVIGRRRAIRIFWLLILCLLIFAFYDHYFPQSDVVVYLLVALLILVFFGLAIYIHSAKKLYAANNLVFTFSQEHDALIEMHLKRIPQSEIINLRTQLMCAFEQMRDYAIRIGSNKLFVQSPLLDAGFATLAAKRAAKRLGGAYQVLPPKPLSCVVSILAYREIHKNDVCKPTLREILGARLTSHGFIIELPT